MSMRTEMRKAAHTIRRAVGGTEPQRDDRDIIEVLKQEHEEVKALLAKLEDATTARERKGLVAEIKAALVPHSKAEEKAVYRRVADFKEKKSPTDGLEGGIEHEMAAKTLLRLEKMKNAASLEHRAAGKVLKDLVEHHIEEEENNIFGDLEENLSEEDRIQMGGEFEAAKKRVRVQ